MTPHWSRSGPRSGHDPGPAKVQFRVQVQAPVRFRPGPRSCPDPDLGQAPVRSRSSSGPGPGLAPVGPRSRSGQCPVQVQAPLWPRSGQGPVQVQPSRAIARYGGRRPGPGQVPIQIPVGSRSGPGLGLGRVQVWVSVWSRSWSRSGPGQVQVWVQVWSRSRPRFGPGPGPGGDSKHGRAGAFPISLHVAGRNPLGRRTTLEESDGASRRLCLSPELEPVFLATFLLRTAIVPVPEILD